MCGQSRVNEDQNPLKDEDEEPWSVGKDHQTHQLISGMVRGGYLG